MPGPVSTPFTHRTVLPASPERVVELRTEPNSVAERYRAAGITGVTVTGRADGAGIVVESERDDAGKLPGPLAKLDTEARWLAAHV
jgi:hypothetical protein